ncbi:MAG: bifunctional riboflavin kinase/FAD synthetase [Candidatus Sumerlaeia bacterium]|nr:bifunctional riboflavin kinase/FAD synthetase [Candidatus Sumerlaeia bacterium]
MTAPDERAAGAAPPRPILIDTAAGLDLRPLGRSTHVTVGMFDGVHTGHRALIGATVARARSAGALAVVVTFQNHPRGVVGAKSAPPLLTTWPRKAELLAALGVDVVAGLPFDEALAATGAEEFVSELLVARCAAAEIASGANFRFGRGGAGDAALLAALAPRLGFAHRQPEFVLSGGAPVSSSRIRAALAEGDAASAAAMLGRPHRVEGPVVGGDRIGRTIGFPTANLAIPAEVCLPRDGVYAVRAGIDGGAVSLPAMMNLGFRPTVGGREHRREAHLIGFEGELGGRRLAVDFVARLRDERRFADLAELRSRLEADKADALSMLATGEDAR